MAQWSRFVWDTFCIDVRGSIFRVVSGFIFSGLFNRSKKKLSATTIYLHSIRQKKKQHPPFFFSHWVKLFYNPLFAQHFFLFFSSSLHSDMSCLIIAPTQTHRNGIQHQWVINSPSGNHLQFLRHRHNGLTKTKNHNQTVQRITPTEPTSVKSIREQS